MNRTHPQKRAALATALALAMAGLACNLPSIPADSLPTLAPAATEPGGLPPTEQANQPASPVIASPPPADSSPTPAAPTPTLSAGLTPYLDPTPAAVTRLDEAELALRNGDWESARALYLEMAASPVSLDEGFSAGIGLAEVALATGDFGTAQATLNQIIAANGDHPRIAQAHFLRGDTRWRLDDCPGAIQDWTSYLTLRPGVIDSFAYERIGDCYLELGDYNAAMAAYDQSTRAGRYVAGQIILHDWIADAARDAGDPARAIPEYQAILSLSENYRYRAQIELYIGQALMENSQREEAFAQWQRVVDQYPDTPEARSALIALLEAERPVDPIQRGLVNYYNDQYETAIEQLGNALAALPPDQQVPAAYLAIARSYRALEDSVSTEYWLNLLINSFSPEDHAQAWGDAWLERAEIKAGAGDLTGALAQIDEFITTRASLPQYAEAFIQGADYAIQAGELPRAASYYQQMGLLYPADSRPAEALAELAIERYEAGDFATAEALARGAADLPGNPRPGRAWLWLGKTLQASGRSDEARAAWQMALQVDGEYGFYGLRAADNLAGRPPFQRDGRGVNAPQNPDEGRAEAEYWLVQQLGLAQSPPVGSLSPALASDPRIIQGAELWELGQLSVARLSFEEVRRAYANDALASYQLAIYFRDIDLYRSSILAARATYRVLGVTAPAGPAFLVRLQYPTHFPELILDYAAEYQLDPLYVYSLIWQESLFEGFAVSSAAAQGLMQIWPPTGEDIAERIAWPDYDASDLQRPLVSVAFGTWLLADEFERLDGDPFAVLVAYNAGTARAIQWQDESAGDPDRFVEAISLSEPQTYVLRIYEHWSVYRALYAGGS